MTNALNLSTILDPDDDGGPILSAPFHLDGGDAHQSDPGPDDQYDPTGVEAQDSAPVFNPAAPLPVLPSIPLAGIVIDAGTIDVPVATTRNLVIGTSNEARLFVLGMIVRVTAGAGTATVAPNGSPDSLGIGFLLPAAAGTPLPVLPVKRLALQLVGPVTVTYAVLASDIPQNG